MLFDVLTEHTERCAATTEHTIRPTPEHWLAVPAGQLLSIGFPQEPRRNGLQVIDAGGHEHRRRQFDEEMHMICFAMALHERATPFSQECRKRPLQVLTHRGCQTLAAVLRDDN